MFYLSLGDLAWSSERSVSYRFLNCKRDAVLCLVHHLDLDRRRNHVRFFTVEDSSRMKISHRTLQFVR